jgi:hypothetical protein
MILAVVRQATWVAGLSELGREQGTEAGGNGGWISTMVLVPAVVDLAGDTPVLAAGASPMDEESRPRSPWARKEPGSAPSFSLHRK